MSELQGKTIPLSYCELSRELQDNMFGAMGQSAVELNDVAKALETQNVDWFKGCQSLAAYYRALSQNLIASQQLLFGSNVTGNSNVDFNKAGDK